MSLCAPCRTNTKKILSSHLHILPWKRRLSLFSNRCKIFKHPNIYRLFIVGFSMVVTCSQRPQDKQNRRAYAVHFCYKLWDIESFVVSIKPFSRPMWNLQKCCKYYKYMLQLYWTHFFIILIEIAREQINNLMKIYQNIYLWKSKAATDHTRINMNKWKIFNFKMMNSYEKTFTKMIQ